MTDYTDKGLLPAGLADVLPPEAGREAEVIERLVRGFAAFGYRRVKPPLIEFEETLLTGSGAALAPQMFRVMDPVSQRMMGLRTDITLQVARIAMTRLGHEPRPLRLSYAGQVLRVRGNQLRPERQFAQAGVELIGTDSLEGDVEILMMACEALGGVGVAKLSIDLTLPTLVPEICAGLGLDAELAETARDALDRKDAAALSVLEGEAAKVFKALLKAAGPADKALEILGRLALPEAAAAMCADLGRLVARLHEAVPGLTLTVDPGEYRGFEYQTGLSFTLFARGVRGELGRGGRYHLPSGEPATGFTLYLDSVRRAVAPAVAQECVYLPFGTPAEAGRGLRAEGRDTLAGLEAEENVEAEARRLGCSHIWSNGVLKALA